MFNKSANTFFELSFLFAMTETKVLYFKKDDEYEHTLRHVYSEGVWTDKLVQANINFEGTGPESERANSGGDRRSLPTFVSLIYR